MNQERLTKVLKSMADQQISQMLISDPPSIFYLTGQWVSPGERMLALYLSLSGNHKLFINDLFPLHGDPGVSVVRFNDNDDPVKIVARHVDKQKDIGIDKKWPSGFLLQLIECQGGKHFINSSFIIDQIRMSKDAAEIALMKAASRINDLAMGKLIELIPQRYSEEKMAQILLDTYQHLGATGFSFTPIVAYGANGADPHHGTDHSLVKPGDSIIIDIGCKKDFYCSDMTRTVFYKQAPELAKKVYQVVLEANHRAIAMIKPGVRFCDIDQAARSPIETAGYGKQFTHRTGHSIGLETHDFGDVSAVNTRPVQPGMIFSVEPGVYFPGEFGVRIEDLVLVTDTGCEVLNSYSKDLLVIE